MFVIQPPVIVSTILDCLPPVENHCVMVTVQFSQEKFALRFKELLEENIDMFSKEC